MVAMRIRQKEGEFYFISYKARDLLERVREIQEALKPKINLPAPDQI